MVTGRLQLCRENTACTETILIMQGLHCLCRDYTACTETKAKKLRKYVHNVDYTARMQTILHSNPRLYAGLLQYGYNIKLQQKLQDTEPSKAHITCLV